MTSDSSQALSQINQELHWAFQYIGKPWANGAQGPDSFDCWALFRHVQKKHFGLDVPVIEVDANSLRTVVDNMVGHDERKHWSRVSVPKQGDAVLMAHHKYPSHVGIWLDVNGGGVLHCIRGEGVVFSTVSSLKTCGWGRVEYFRHASNA